MVVAVMARARARAGAGAAVAVANVAVAKVAASKMDNSGSPSLHHPNPEISQHMQRQAKWMTLAPPLPPPSQSRNQSRQCESETQIELIELSKPTASNTTREPTHNVCFPFGDSKKSDYLSIYLSVCRSVGLSGIISPLIRAATQSHFILLQVSVFIRAVPSPKIVYQSKPLLLFISSNPLVSCVIRSTPSPQAQHRALTDIKDAVVTGAAPVAPAPSSSGNHNKRLNRLQVFDLHL